MLKRCSRVPITNLQKRILTALILVSGVVSCIIFLDPPTFGWVAALFFLSAAWEWSRLSGFESIWGRLFCVFSLFALGLCILIALQGFNSILLPIITTLPILLFWIMALIAVIVYPRAQHFLKSKCVGVVVGCFLLGPAYFFLMALKGLDPKWVLYVLALVCACDTGAYFVGKRYGQKKLAPLLSPGKTWEGVLGGMACGLIVIGLSAVYLEPKVSIFNWMLLGFITLVFSIVGDLFESLFKRLRGLKESGSLLPGHGGVLDRIDSLTAAIPIFGIGLLFLG
jgi:phosphatidate cytidylyltransferase